jgi:4-hydroxy-tetrahydrodipicolinate synthase
MARFGRMLTAMVTPFDGNGGFDPALAAKLATWMVDEGHEGLVIAGTTGESPVLTDTEKTQLFEAVRHAVDVPIIAGTTGSDTAHDIALTRQAAAIGVDAILALCPYYSRPSQAGIEAHLRAIAAATDLPVVLYDIPVRTGRKISHDVIVRLATEVPNIVGLKYAAGNPGATARVVAETPDDFEVYSGDDAMTLPLLAVGAVGAISVAGHWTARDQVEMFDRWEAGDAAGARAVHDRLLESWAFETGDEAPNPIPAKAMLRHLGVEVGECRLPLGRAPDWVSQRAADVWSRLEAARG